jgi:hypothetical protein
MKIELLAQTTEAKAMEGHPTRVEISAGKAHEVGAMLLTALVMPTEAKRLFAAQRVRVTIEALSD